MRSGEKKISKITKVTVSHVENGIFYVIKTEQCGVNEFAKETTKNSEFFAEKN